MPGVLERKVRLLLPLVGGRGSEAAVAAGEIAGEIEWAKARLVRPEGYADAAARARREPPRPAADVAAIYERYEHEKRRRRVVDFDDLIWWCADALESDAEFAAVQRWRFRHLFVDEFQDTSPAQFRLIRGWLGDRTDLCVVGDPNQSIYGFAGADAGMLTRFRDHFGGARVVQLDHNYRSTPQVVSVANALLADGGGTPRPAVHAVGPGGPAPTVTAYDDDDAEAAGVASRLRDAHGADRPWSSMAVLYRINAQSAAFEAALSAAGVPFRVRGAGRFLERPEVKVALQHLREAVGRSPSGPFVERLDELAREATGHGRLPGTDEPAGGAERREHVGALVRLGHEYVSIEGGTGSLDGFLAYLTAALRDDAVDAGDDVVELLTFHRAKGLEFTTVFVTGLERGLVPISHAETPAERAEERRLLYVALTRAERELHLSYAKLRTLGSRAVRRQRSPWLAPIEESITPGAGRPAATSARDRLAEARDKLTREPADDDADPELLAALVEWRRNLARVNGVPAYVIFHDTTLRAIAASRPESRDDLLADARDRAGEARALRRARPGRGAPTRELIAPGGLAGRPSRRRVEPGEAVDGPGVLGGPVRDELLVGLVAGPLEQAAARLHEVEARHRVAAGVGDTLGVHDDRTPGATELPESTGDTLVGEVDGLAPPGDADDPGRPLERAPHQGDAPVLAHVGERLDPAAGQVEVGDGPLVEHA